jgi:hypothetical protein
LLEQPAENGETDKHRVNKDRVAELESLDDSASESLSDVPVLALAWRNYLLALALLTDDRNDQACVKAFNACQYFALGFRRLDEKLKEALRELNLLINALEWAADVPVALRMAESLRVTLAKVISEIPPVVEET